MTDILLFGRNGQLGHALGGRLGERFDVRMLGSNELDLADVKAVRSAIAELRPALVVNTAAYTAVDRAESERDAAFAVNASAPAAMAEALMGTGGALLHFSTDFVFDGSAQRPYGENDPTSPVNVYGASKLAGEEAIRAAGAAHMILRTSWLYATRGNNFLLTIARLLRERESLSVVNDQVGSPTWVEELARLVDAILPDDAAGLSRFVHENEGLYHLSCEGAVSWYEFALRIREKLHDRGEQPCEISPIPSSEYRTAAARPAYSVLSKQKFRSRFGEVPADWYQALDAAFETMPDPAAPS
jgi:dTDP-4-dehydrorhamnose reductase